MKDRGFSVVDLLIIIALLLIVIGLFGPLVMKPTRKAKSPATHAAMVLPLTVSA